MMTNDVDTKKMVVSTGGIRCFIDTGIHGALIDALITRKGLERVAHLHSYEVLSTNASITTQSASEHRQNAGQLVRFKLHPELPPISAVVTDLWGSDSSFDVALTLPYLRWLEAERGGRIHLDPAAITFRDRAGRRVLLSGKEEEGKVDEDKALAEALRETPMAVAADGTGLSRLRGKKAAKVASLV